LTNILPYYIIFIEVFDDKYFIKRGVKTMNDADIKAILENHPVKCSKCGSPVYYKGSGKYICSSCENIEYDEFGKVKKYLDEHGISTMGIISEETGVPIKHLNLMLREGRVEIPDGSKFYIKCEVCGCSIRYGRFCPDCVRRTATDLRQAFYVAEMGEKPKQSGIMRFYNNEKDSDTSKTSKNSKSPKTSKNSKAKTFGSSLTSKK